MTSTRDPSLPTAYSDGLDRLSLTPLWTALHALLPHERATQATPHCWRWAEVRGPLLEAARLVPMEQAERRVLVLRNPGLGGRRDGAEPSSHSSGAPPGGGRTWGLHHRGWRPLRDGAG